MQPIGESNSEQAFPGSGSPSVWFSMHWIAFSHRRHHLQTVLQQPAKIFAQLDAWLRHRLRAIQLKQWKTAFTAYREMRRLGAFHETAAGVAAHVGRWWRGSQLGMNSVFTVAHFDRLGVPRFS